MQFSILIMLHGLQDIMASVIKPCWAGNDCETAAVLVMGLQNAVQAKLRKTGMFKADGVPEYVVDMFGYQVRACAHTSHC